MTDTAQERDWSAYWQARGAAGEAFLGEGVEQHPALAAHWDAVFAAAPEDAAVLDVATGAGSVLKRAHAAGLAHLTGTDVSRAALDLMQKALPDAGAVEAPADAVPLPDAGFDLVTSQFGFEYAGPDAALEMLRLTKPGGTLAALGHLRGSVIEREVAANAETAAAVQRTGFSPAARRLIEAEFAVRRTGEGQDAARAAQSAFQGPEAALAMAIAKEPQGLGAHLYHGFRQLYQKQRAYDLADITGWLDGMDREVAAFEGRMRTMRTAAMDEGAMQALTSRLTEAGAAEAGFEPMTLPGEAGPSCWVLSARKAQ